MSWTSQTVEAVPGRSSGCSLALDNAGNPWISYAVWTSCGPSLRLARFRPRAAVLYRGVVPSVTFGWKPLSLPLTDLNDDATAPFPIATAQGGSADDAIPATAPLTLYRVLLEGTTDAGNVLLALKRPGSVHLHF